LDVGVYYLPHADGDAAFAITLRAACAATVRDAAATAPMDAEIAGALVHDFNNLIKIVGGCCDQLRNSDLTPTQRSTLDHIAVAADRATSLARRLVRRRSDDDRSRVVIDVRRGLDALRGLLQRAIGDSNRLDLNLADEATFVQLDEAELTQIVLNLALNARDAMLDGGVFSIRTSVTASRDEGNQGSSTAHHYLKIEATDSGSGMSEEVRSRAFEPYFTTKGSTGGTGQGLASVRALLARRGGVIDVASEPGQGTTFRIYLPLVSEVPADHTTTRSTDTGARPGETALVSDDEPAVREIVGSLLRSLGYETVEATSASDAVETVSARRIDVLVTDLVMPDASGPELARQIAARSPRTRILFMSGDTLQLDLLQVSTDSPTAFLQKPFDREAIGRTIRELLDSGRGTAPWRSV
jgi:nitrogen-specific signal transduction histidine kinase/CheY-like chemotaxis protein